MDISGLNKAQVLMALYDHAKPQGMGFLQYTPEPLTMEEATQLLQEHTYFDYLRGRVMKVDLSGDELRTDLYNRDNGPGAAEYAIGIIIAGDEQV